MEKVQTKAPGSRRGKFLFLGLLILIVVLTLYIYRQRNFQKDLIRRKAFLISKLRESKADQGKLRLEVEGQKRNIAMRDTEIKQVQYKLNNLEATTSSYKQQIQHLEKSANEYKASVASLQTQYDDASSSLRSLKDNLDNTVDSCQLTKNKNEELKKEIDEKENILEKCLQEKDTKSKEMEDMENNYKRQITSLQQTQSPSQQTSNVSPSNDVITQNQLPNLAKSKSNQQVNNSFLQSTQTRSDQTVSDARANRMQSSTPAQSQIPPAINEVSTQHNKVTQLGTDTGNDQPPSDGI